MTDSNSTNPGRANESLSADDLAFHLVPAAEQDTECIGKLLQAIQAWSTRMSSFYSMDDDGTLELTE